jgi:broad specificity phosphatase PhoE
MTDLLQIRHGQATHNLEGRWEGWGETPLTEEGKRQAEALAIRVGSWLPPVRVLYTSPLRRAKQTVEPIAQRLGLTPVVCDDLREMNFGQVGGLTLDSFQESMPELHARWQDRGDMAFKFPGGEQRLAFFRRAGGALDAILTRHPQAHVAVVAHGGTLRAGLAYLFPNTMGNWWNYALDNGSLTHVRTGPPGHSILLLNDCSHLGAT